MKPSAPTRIQLCGRLVVVWADARIETRLPSRQGRLLFAYLVVNRDHARSRAEIVEAIWPEQRPAATGPALNALLSKLRALLGRDAIAGSDEPRLRLGDDAFVDLEYARERLHTAESASAMGEWHRAWAPARAALHTSSRGFLTGHEAPWIDEVRRSLEQMRLRALECVASVGVGLGGPELPSAERAARELIALAPLGEAGYLHLIAALRARERVPEALLVYDQLRVRLRDELGISPSPRAQAVHRDLL